MRMDSGYILKIEAAKCANGFTVGQKERGESSMKLGILA